MVAYALSKIQGYEMLAIALSLDQGSLLDEIKDSWKQDKYLCVLLEKVKFWKESQFVWKQELLRKMGKLVVGNIEGLR